MTGTEGNRMAQASRQQRENEEVQAARPYAASWVDRLTRWVDKFPGPAWLYYGCAALLSYVVYLAVKWGEGSLPVGDFPRIQAVVVGSMFYYLALLDHLNKVASTAMSRFRSAATAPHEVLAALEMQLTTMGSRSVWAATAAGLVFGSAVMIAAWQGLLYADAGLFSSPLAALLEVVVVLGLSINLLVFVLHTIQQLLVVNTLYTTYTRVDMFDLAPVYAFSRLSAQTAIGVILLQVIWQTGEPWLAADTLTLATGAVVVLLAIVTFILPLRGLNRLLVKEKQRLKSIAGQRLRRCIETFNSDVDDAAAEQVEALAAAIEGADLELKIVNRIPTWPWQAGTLRSVAGAVLLPLFLWLVTRILEEIVAF
jgi:hypothetical protein